MLFNEVTNTEIWQLFLEIELEEDEVIYLLHALYFAYSANDDTDKDAYGLVSFCYIIDELYYRLPGLMDCAGPEVIDVYVYELGSLMSALEMYRHMLFYNDEIARINYQIERSIEPYLKKYRQAVSYFDHLSDHQQLMIIKQIGRDLGFYEQTLNQRYNIVLDSQMEKKIG